MRTKTLKNTLYTGSRHVVLVGLCIMVVFPIFWAGVTSFKPANEVFSLSLLARHPTLENYHDVFITLPLGRLLLNTFFMAALVTLGVLVISVCAAYAFVRWDFRGKNVLFLLFLGTLLIPVQITIIPNYLTLAQLGWLNTLPGLTIPQMATGLGIFYLRQQFNNFPQELFDAGMIDGMGPLGLLWSILLPNMRSVLVVLAIILFIQTWNEYFWPLLVGGDLTSTTVQVGLQVFLQENGNAWGALMAASMLSLLPVLILYALAQRQIVAAFVRSGIQ
jgi:ABC-type glycerol-3-phosphate transport system permease component